MNATATGPSTTENNAAQTTTRPATAADLVRIAAELFDRRPNWSTFYRDVLGAEGIVRAVYRAPEALRAFERTAEYRDIQQMLRSLREDDPSLTRQVQRVITVRLPKEMHDSLVNEAHERRTSMNKLCISKLLQALEEGAEGSG